MPSKRCFIVCFMWCPPGGFLFSFRPAVSSTNKCLSDCLGWGLGVFLLLFLFMGVVMGLIVYGPQGCGKSTRAKQIADLFGLKRIIDDGVDESGNLWSAGDPVDSDTLVLTSDPTGFNLEFGQVMSIIDRLA